MNGDMVTGGLADPLEFLEDIAVDAPLARGIMTRIVKELVANNIIRFDFFLEVGSDMYRESGDAARMAEKVGEGMEGIEEVISKLKV